MSATVTSEISYLRVQAKTNIKRYIDERLPEDENCLVGLNAITKEARNIEQHAGILALLDDFCDYFS